MANRTLSRLLLTAFGVSLLAGAGQLGLAFGFGIIRLTGAFNGATVNQWPAQLVWVGWFAANAAVIGAVLTERVARQEGRLTGTGRQLAVAGSAALGATVVAPLCMQPARSAELISVDPVWAVAICAILGAVVGAGAALAVLVRPPFAWNMAALAGAMWLIALLSVVPSLGAGGPLTPVRLGVLEPAWLSVDTAQQLALLILPLLALLAGLAGGAVARWRGHPALTSGPSGVAGPVLVAFAYLAAGPGDSADRYQLAPYYGALIAIAVGALGSAAAALLPWPLTGRSASGTPAIEPTAILQPLPPTPALPASSRRPAEHPVAAADTPPHWQWPEPQPSLDPPTAAEVTTEAGLGARELPPASAADRHPVPFSATDRLSTTEPEPTEDAATTEPEALEAAATTGPGSTEATVSAVEIRGAAPTPASAQAPAAADPAADSAPVGDGSDIPLAGRSARSPLAPAPASSAAPDPVEASVSVGKTPTPRRTRKPRAGTTAAAAEQQPEQSAEQKSEQGKPAVLPETTHTSDDADPAAPTATSSGATGPGAHPDLTAQAASDEGARPTQYPSTATDSAPLLSAELRPEPAPRPRHRLSLPELNSTTPWNAFAPARPADPPPAEDQQTTTFGTPRAVAATTAPTATEPPTPTGHGHPTFSPSPASTSPSPEATTPGLESPAPAGLEAVPPAAEATAPAGTDPRATARGLSAAFAATPARTTDPAATARDLSAAFTKPPAVAPEDIQPGEERDKGLRGLFRRGRSRPDSTVDGEEPLPAQDEEYVDWVTGLGRPVTEDEPAPKTSRRSLRSTGRHHRD
ncbi:hypothetical protein [Micromonospora sp. DT229]|uniref:hypothetical protein n=1 Tax=Micromonospora sp. DT229 TaxID=3393430 RepID=UPI003CE8F1A3